MPEQYEVKNEVLTLYIGGFAHIQATLQAKNGVNQITGISEQAIHGTLHPTLDTKDATILRERTLEPTSLKEIAESQIGESVLDSEKSVKALSVIGDQLLVSDDNGHVYSKPLTMFQYSPVDVRQKRSLEVELGGLTDAEKTIHVGYLTEGITLTPHYNVLVTPVGLVLTAEALVRNGTGKSYKVDFEIIPSEVGRPYFTGGDRGYRPCVRRVAALGAGSIDYVGEEVAEFEEGGQIGYTLGEREIPKGESRLGIFTTKPLNYKIILKATLGNIKREGDMKPDIDTFLRFKAPKNLHAGSVAVYGEVPSICESKTTTRERYEGGGEIGKPVLKDQNVDIALRTPDTLDMKVKQIGETKFVRTDIGTAKAPVFASEREFEVTTNNQGQDNVTIETYLHLRANERLLKYSIPHKERSGSIVRWDILVEAGKEMKFTYTFQSLKIQDKFLSA